MTAFSAYALMLTLLLIKISIADVRYRIVKHSDLGCLAVLILLPWLIQPNVRILSVSACILIVGFVLHIFKLLGAGDTKLLVVLSLGVDTSLWPLLIFGSLMLGGLFALGYLIYGLATDLQTVRKKGIPYAVPISIAGGSTILISYVKLFL